MINHHNTQRTRNEVYLLEKDAYVLCLHVKPTSLFCGFIMLIMSLMHIVVLLSGFTIEFNPADKDASSSQLHSQMDPRLKTNKLIVLYIIAESLKLLISSLLIYGITRCKPSYLIPFFLMQLFYFFRSISFFLEHYANYQHYYQNSSIYRDELDNRARNDTPQSYPMLIFFFSLLYKLYFITAVFKCYKYLKIKEATMHINHSFQIRSQHHQPVNATIAVLHHQPTNPPSYNDCLHVNLSKDDAEYVDQKLPSYDEACKIVVQPEKNDASSNSVSTNATRLPNTIDPKSTTGNAQV